MRPLRFNSLFVALAALLGSNLLGYAEDWPQWMGTARDGVWREDNVVQDFSAGAPQVTWRSPISGGYAGPAVAAGRVFVTDFVGRAEGASDPDMRSSVVGTERVICLSERDGKQLWVHQYSCSYNISYPDGPRATPTVDDDRVYTLGAEGDLCCLRVVDGTIVWCRNLRDEYAAVTPMWGYAGHPLIFGESVICLAGGEGSAVVALDKMTGEEKWKALTTPDIAYCPPTMIVVDGRSQLLIWHAKSLNCLDPETGTVHWSESFAPDYGMAIAPPIQIGNVVFVGGIKQKSMALRLGSEKPVRLWSGSAMTGIGPSHSPVVVDRQDPSYFYGVDRGGELRCIELKTGKQLWASYELVESKRRSNSATAFLTPHGDRYFIFSETGALVIAKLSPQGYHEVGRTGPLLEATHDAFGRGVVWCPPAFSGRAMFVRNSKELIRVSLATP